MAIKSDRCLCKKALDYLWLILFTNIFGVEGGCRPLPHQTRTFKSQPLIEFSGVTIACQMCVQCKLDIRDPYIRETLI